MNIANTGVLAVDSFNRRYFYKLSTSVVGFVLSFISAAIIPRGLGPVAYGNFSFLTNFFTQITGFLDMGTSFCFYNKLSQRPKDFSLVVFYRYFVLIVASVVIFFVFIARLTPIHIRLWPEQKLFYVYLAAGWGILNWVANNLFNKMTDAYGLTVPAEKARIFQKSLGLILIILLYVFGQLNLRNYFYYQYFILFFAGVMFIWIMESRGYSISKGWKLSLSKIKSYSKEFYHFSHPLFVTSVFVLFVGIFDRWLLQVFSGSVQQGLFGFSYQIGALCFLFVGAMSPLLMREFSIGFGNKDLKQVASLFRKYTPLMYAITAFIACFVAVQATKIIYIIGGEKYSLAVIPVTIMAFAPIHQTYGQLSSSVLLAAGKTRMHRNIDIIFLLIGLPLVYFLIAPKQMGGADAGATGLAIKTISGQLILVNTYLFFCAKLIKINFWKYIAHQIFSVGCFVLIAFFSVFCVDKLVLRNSEIVISKFLLAGFIYTAAAIAFIFYFPVLLGLEKRDLQFLISRITQVVRSKFKF